MIIFLKNSKRCVYQVWWEYFLVFVLPICFFSFCFSPIYFVNVYESSSWRVFKSPGTVLYLGFEIRQGKIRSVLASDYSQARSSYHYEVKRIRDQPSRERKALRNQHTRIGIKDRVSSSLREYSWTSRELNSRYRSQQSACHTSCPHLTVYHGLAKTQLSEQRPR